MSDAHGTPFSTERELAEDEAGREPPAPARAGYEGPADKAPPPNPRLDQEALDKGLESLHRIKPY